MPRLLDVQAEQARLSEWAARKDDRGAPSPTSLAREYRAAIVRGRTEQLQVTREHVNRIMRTYESAGKSLQAQVTGTPEWMTGHEGALDQARLRTLMRSIDGILTGLHQDYAGLLDVGMLDVAQVAATRESAMQALGLVPANDPDLMASMQRKFELSDGSSAAVQFGRVAEGAVNALAQRYYGDGLKLSDRLGALTGATRQAIEDTLVQGVTEQVSAGEMASRLEALFVDVKSESPAFRAWRIARTEIAQAHREAHIQSVVDQRTGLKRGYVEAVGFRLSLSHPENDICDVWASDDSGLGAGNYEPGDVPTDHCFGMCWTITVIRDMPNIALPVLAADPDSVPDSQVRYYADRLGDPAAIRRVGAGG